MNTRKRESIRVQLFLTDIPEEIIKLFHMWEKMLSVLH